MNIMNILSFILQLSQFPKYGAARHTGERVLSARTPNSGHFQK